MVRPDGLVVRRRSIEVLDAPQEECFDRGPERLSGGCQAVAHLPPTGLPPSFEDPGGLELAKPRAELAGDVGAASKQVREAQLAGQQVAHDQQAPAFAEALEGLGHRAEVVIAVI